MHFRVLIIFSMSVIAFMMISMNKSLAAAVATDETSTLPNWHTQVFQEIESIYLPAQTSLGLNLQIQIDRSSLSEYAKAERQGVNAVVTVSAPLLRNSRLSPDGLRMILCHELGHVLGGSPRRNLPMEWEGPMAHDGLSEASAEGQADYYASLICFRRVVAGQNHTAHLTAKPLGSRVAKLCDDAHGGKSEGSLICQRAALGADNMLQLTKDFPISFELPSATIADKLVRNSYPERQCRLDTFISGAICRTPVQTDKSGLALDFDNSALNDCSQPSGQRPKCWYQ